LSLPAAKQEHRATVSGMGDRYHVYPDASGFRLPDMIYFASAQEELAA
jgi:hypothetical protein